MTESSASATVPVFEAGGGGPDEAGGRGQPHAEQGAVDSEPRVLRRASLMNSRTSCCQDGCRLSARICRECVRALAFQWWDAIARHDIGDSRCELCGHTGGAIYCAEHALDAIVEHRALIRSLGHRIGEPPPVDVTDLLDRGLG